MRDIDERAAPTCRPFRRPEGGCSQNDGREMTRKAARRTWLDSFYDAQPADLPEAERRRRAKLAIKARIAGLALKSSMVRAKS